MTGPPPAFRLWPYLLGILLGLCAGLVLFVFLGARHIDDRTREWVIRELSARFDSQVESVTTVGGIDAEEWKEPSRGSRSRDSRP